MTAIDVSINYANQGDLWAALGKSVMAGTDMDSGSVGMAVRSTSGTAMNWVTGPTPNHDATDSAAVIASHVFPLPGAVVTFTFKLTGKSGDFGQKWPTADGGVNAAIVLGSGTYCDEYGAGLMPETNRVLVDQYITNAETANMVTVTATVPDDYRSNGVDNGVVLYLYNKPMEEVAFGIVEPTMEAVGGAEPEPEPEPDPEPEPEPWQVPLAERVARNLGRPGDLETIGLAVEHVELVTEYARGYTRGRGFTDDAPNRGISAVIVAAASKLTANPEQLTTYTSGDYSERGAILAGWTLTELGVLNNWRKRQS